MSPKSLSRPAASLLSLLLPLVVAACATAPSAADPPPLPSVEPMPTEGLDFAEAACVGEALVDEAVRTSRRVARATHRARFDAARHDQHQWEVRERYVRHLQDLAWAQAVTLHSPPEAIERAQGILSRVGRTEYERLYWQDVEMRRPEHVLRANGNERAAIVADSAEEYLALARAHLDVFQAGFALEVAERAGRDTSAAAAALSRVEEALGERVNDDPVLELVYQEEFELAYLHSSICDDPSSNVALDGR